MLILEGNNITKSFVPEVIVLDDVSLSVRKGDFISIEGASGSGKSTLLTILAGIDKPDSGEVLLLGEDITKLSERDLAILRRTTVGFVFQFFNLAPYLTVKENILLPIMLAKKKVAAYYERMEEILDHLGISAYRDKLPSTLSGGEQQRVAIARALIFDPEILFLDEPTGNLDSKNSESIMLLLKSINKEMNTTIIQVTHSQENAQFGNRIITIRDGKIANSSVD